MWMEQRQAALEAQSALAEIKRAEAAGAEANLRVAEAELDFLADTRQASEVCRLVASLRACGVATWSGP